MAWCLSLSHYSILSWVGHFLRRHTSAWVGYGILKATFTYDEKEISICFPMVLAMLAAILMRVLDGRGTTSIISYLIGGRPEFTSAQPYPRGNHHLCCSLSCKNAHENTYPRQFPRLPEVSVGHDSVFAFTCGLASNMFLLGAPGVVFMARRETRTNGLYVGRLYGCSA